MRPEQTILTIDEAIDRIGNGPFQQKILIAAGSCFMADAMEVMLLSFLALTLENDWKLTKDQTASIVSLVFIGAMVGNLILGPAGDRLGRQPIFYICSLIIGIFGIVTSFVHSYVALILVRFVVGIGLGGLTVPFDILAEFTPTKQRSKYLILIELFWTLGSFLTVLVAYGTLGQGISWRVFVSLCAMPCFLSMLLVKMFVPESPHWLVAQGRTDEALKVLYRGALENGNDPVSLFPPGCMLLVDGMDHSTRSDAIISTEQSLNDPKNEKRRHPYHSYPFSLLCTKVMFVLCVVWFGSTFGYYGTIIAVTRIFSNVDDEDSDKTSFDYMAFFISALAEIVGAIMIFRMIERLGRVPTLVFSLLGAGVALFLLCFVVTFGRPLQIFFAFSSRVFEMMISSTVWIMTPELLSTQVRASGHGIASAIARIGGCLSPFVVTKEPLPTVGIIMLLVHVLTAAVSLRLPETKGVAMGSAVEVGVLSRSRCSTDQDDAQGID